MQTPASREAPTANIQTALTNSPARRHAAATTEPPTPVRDELCMVQHAVRGSGLKPLDPVLSGTTKSGGTGSSIQHDEPSVDEPSVLTLCALDVYGRVTTLELQADTETVTIHRITAGKHELLATLDKSEFSRWLTYPNFARQFENVTLFVDSSVETNGRLAFIFASAIWYLSAKQENRLYRYLKTKRRVLTAEAFMKMLWAIGIQAYVADTDSPYHLFLFLDQEHSSPDTDIPKILELPPVAQLNPALTGSSFIHIVTLSAGDPPWPNPPQ